MNTIKIRKALPSDLSNLMDLENNCFTSDKISQQSYRSLLKKHSAEIIIAEYDRNIIGSAILFFRKNSKIARLYSLAVHPNYRKQGIAARVCEEIRKCALKRSCERIVLEVRPDNKNAIHFYEKNGYTIFGHYSKFYEDKMDALRMQTEIRRIDQQS